jgi:CheY-like chemotaxis protein
MYSVFLIEDSPADVLLVREALAEYGLSCELIVSKDGEEAIHRIDEFDRAATPCPDLVILDINLPKKSGYEVLERIRTSSRCGSIPVVMLSSSTAATDRERALALGSFCYLPKPPVLDDFIKLGAVFKDILSTSKPPTSRG